MGGNSFTISTAVVAFVGVAALTMAAPFELTQPLVRLPRQSISNLEAVLLLVFVSWGVALVWYGDLPRWQTPLTAPWLTLLVILAIAALVSPVSRLNALHMTGRLAAAFAVFVLTVNGVTSRARVRAILALALATGVVVSVIACLEYLRVRPVLDALKLFRPGITAVGAQLRAGGTLQYPTIASMYLEIVFAGGLGLMLTALDEARPVRVVIVCAALLIVAEAITLTFTRAGLITMAASLALVAVVRRLQRNTHAGTALIAALAVAIAGLFVASRSAESMRLRFTSEGQESWYRASFAPPARIELPTGRTTAVKVDVTNTGRLVWDSRAEMPIYLSYHWLPVDSNRFVMFEGARTEFPTVVPPGATASVEMNVRAPATPGRYRLEWDVVQEGRLWFSTEPGAMRALSPATIVGAPGDASLDRPMRALKPAVRPGRFTLWRAAARMVAAHPWLGVGPDNFRLTYGEYAGLTSADPRLHSNNMYIEMLASGGLIGAGAFAWLLWRTGATVLRAMPIETGVAAATLAIAVHGVVDSFLSFAATYIVFSITLGLAVACARGRESWPDAHRV
jgi:O-Antigen ligase